MFDSDSHFFPVSSLCGDVPVLSLGGKKNEKNMANKANKKNEKNGVLFPSHALHSHPSLSLQIKSGNYPNSYIQL